MYYRRQIEERLIQAVQQFPILLVTGPRQVGKTTMLRELFKDSYAYVTLDDPLLQAQIQQDAGLFLENYPSPLLIDEVQNAPGLFPYLKMKVDADGQMGQFVMTGSQTFAMMKNVSESLAGRVGILGLQGISLREKYELGFSEPFLPSPAYLEAREVSLVSYKGLWETIHRGYMPNLVFHPDYDWNLYYSSYVKTYIERDVRQLSRVGDEASFIQFMTAMAARTGQLLNYQDVAKDLGLSNETVKRWTSILENSGIIYLLRPYANNHLKRAIKTPKLYFMDTGLAAYLTGWPTAETLMKGAVAGNFFESFVIGEIYRSYLNAGITHPPLYFYRDRDGKEVDLLIEQGDQIYPIEIKMTASPVPKMVQNAQTLQKMQDRQVQPATILCQYPQKFWLTREVLALPVSYL